MCQRNNYVDKSSRQKNPSYHRYVNRYKRKEKPLENIKVVYEYPDVFLEELSGMPPDRDIEFSIELLPRTAPISKRP
jgi:hypothetical protein